jgi:hypothetical protein
MSTPRDADQKKLPYEKPHLRTIELVAEEVLSVGCKIVGSTGPFGSANCLTPLVCNAPGS